MMLFLLGLTGKCPICGEYMTEYLYEDGGIELRCGNCDFFGFECYPDGTRPNGYYAHNATSN